MYGPHIEQQFTHIEFENKQLKRRMAAQRMLEAEHQNHKHPQRSLMDLFGRCVPRVDLMESRVGRLLALITIPADERELLIGDLASRRAASRWGLGRERRERGV